MSELAPGLSLRIRPRTVPPGVTPPPGTPPPPEAPQPAGEPVLPDMSGLPVASPSLLSKGASRPPIPVSFSRPPIPVAPPLVPAGSPASHPPAATAATPPPPPFPSPPPIPNPGASVPPPQLTAEEVAKYKLRQAPVLPPSVPPPPTKAPAANAAVPAAAMAVSPLLAPRQRPEDSKVFRWGVRLFFLIGIGLAVCFVWVGWSFIKERYGFGSSAPAPAASTSSNANASLPKKAIDRAKETVAAVNAIQAGAPPEAAPATAGSAAKPSAKTTAETRGKALAASAIQVSFEDYVNRLKVSGVAGGSKARALIDGTMRYPGQVMDERLGIVFEGIDHEKHQLIFRDRNGARATLKY